jgi:hypothetical protein
MLIFTNILATAFVLGTLVLAHPPPEGKFKLVINSERGGGEGEATKASGDKQGANGVVYSIPEWKSESHPAPVRAIAKTRKDANGAEMQTEMQNVLAVCSFESFELMMFISFVSRSANCSTMEPTRMVATG